MEYKQKDIQKIFPDVPGKTLIYWARIGLIEWDSETRNARGVHREYSLWNLFQIAIVRELTDLGITYDLIRWAMDLYFKDFRQGPPISELRMVVQQRGGKASASGAERKVLILGKHKAGRGWKDWKSGDLDLRDPAGVKEFVDASKSRVSWAMINLPAIFDQIKNATGE